MKKFQINIPKPCHENWEGMTPADQGKFCAACSKTVTDFSSMSDSQLAAFFKKHPGPLCGRFHNDQLDRVINGARKPAPALRYLFTIAIPTFLFSVKASSQRGAEPRIDTTYQLQGTMGFVAMAPAPETGSITGQVVDEKGEPIPSAVVILKEKKQKISSDANGAFSFSGRFGKRQLMTLEVSCVGFEPKTDKITPGATVTVVLTRSLIADTSSVAGKGDNGCSRIRMGAYVVISENELPAVSNIEKRSFIPKLLDAAFCRFAVYPNPARSGSVLTAELKRGASGSYIAELINSAGAVLKEWEVAVEEKSSGISLPLPETASGSYFIRFRQVRTGRQYLEKIIIQ